MPLADAFAGMRHFSIERTNCCARFRRRLIDRFYEPDALFGDPLANDRSIIGPRQTARSLQRRYNRSVCLMWVQSRLLSRSSEKLARKIWPRCVERPESTRLTGHSFDDANDPARQESRSLMSRQKA
jgi:hypothetical protein